MKKSDLIIISVVILIAAIMYGGYYAQHSEDGMQIVLIKHAGEEVDRLILTNDLTFEKQYEYDGQLNTVSIADGKVSVSSANCPDQLCVKSGNISKVGESLICLPHQFTVEIISDKKSESKSESLDGVSN